MSTDTYQTFTINDSIGLRPKRCLSYNDLKKKRLLRSQKSKSKLYSGSQQKSALVIKTTQKKKAMSQYKTILSQDSTPNDQKKLDNYINDLKDVFLEMKQKAKTKKSIASKPFITERNYQQKKTYLNQKSKFTNNKSNMFFGSISMAGDEKDLIRQIISQKKSQRRLLKFQEIRAQVKRSKSKSKQKALQQDTAAQSRINHSKSNSDKRQVQDMTKSTNKIRLSKFQIIKQPTQKPLSLKPNYQSQRYSRKLKLNNQKDFCTDRPSDRKDIKTNSSVSQLKFHRRLKKSSSHIIIKSTQSNLSSIANSEFNQYQSTIMATQRVGNKRDEQNNNYQSKTVPISNNPKNLNKRGDFEDLISQSNELPQLQLSKINISSISESSTQKQATRSILELNNCLNLFDQVDMDLQNEIMMVRKRNLQNLSNIENVSNVLDLMILPTQQLKIKIKENNKKLKKKNQLEKFKKIFPKNFFKD